MTVQLGCHPEVCSEERDLIYPQIMCWIGTICIVKYVFSGRIHNPKFTYYMQLTQVPSRTQVPAYTLFCNVSDRTELLHHSHMKH